MHSLAVSKDGKIYAAWLDERNIQQPKPSKHAGGHHMESNRELFVAQSVDGGKTFSSNRKVAENACPCCKTALTVSPDGSLLIQEAVKGTPALTTENNRSIAIWQGMGAQQPETKMRELGGAGIAVSVVANAELPSGALCKDKLFVAYVTRVGEKRSVWLAKLG